MSERQKTLQLKTYNKDYLVTLLYDECKTGESQYGRWALFGVEFQGESQSLFADENLQSELAKFGKGSKLIVRHNQDENGQLTWSVIPANGNSQTKATKTVSSYIDEKSASIQRAMALKIAVISIGTSIKPWNDDDLQEIKVRMEKLLEILVGSTSDDLPF